MIICIDWFCGRIRAYKTKHICICYIPGILFQTDLSLHFFIPLGLNMVYFLISFLYTIFLTSVQSITYRLLYVKFWFYYIKKVLISYPAVTRHLSPLRVNPDIHYQFFRLISGLSLRDIGQALPLSLYMSILYLSAKVKKKLTIRYNATKIQFCFIQKKEIPNKSRSH